MNLLLDKNLFFIKEQVGIFKASNNFDIFDPENNEMIMTCREENLGFVTRLFRFTDFKRMTPFHVEIKSAKGEKILSVKRGFAFILSTVQVMDENDKLIGLFKQKLFSIGGKFEVQDANGIPLCMLKGKWTSWNFKFMKEEVIFAEVSKKWAGIGKEFFTTADNYILKVEDRVSAGNPLRMLILAAVMCIDMVLKE